jgi:hypothetical protein
MHAVTFSGTVMSRQGGSVKKRKQIQSRPEQRRRLDADWARVFEGRKLDRKEVRGWGSDEFSGEELSSMLSPDPGYSKKVLRHALAWLNAGYENGDMRSFDVRKRWYEFQAYVGAWRRTLRHEMRNSKDQQARREAGFVVTLANAWAAGHLPAVRTCVVCAEFFLAQRSNQQFCTGKCRATFYHDIETLHPDYKDRKAREAVKRRKIAKERELRDYVRNIMSDRKVPERQLDVELMGAAPKFKVTLSAVKRIARSLSPTKDGTLLADSHKRPVASGKH